MKILIVTSALLVCALPMAQAQPALAPVRADATPDAALPTQNQGLKISISPTYKGDENQNNGGPSIGLRRADPRINVVLQNTSDKPIRIYQDWNSWGENNLTLEITKVDGKVLAQPLRLVKLGLPLRANIASTDTLRAGEAIVREVRLQLPRQIFEPKAPASAEDLNAKAGFYFGFPFPPSDNSRTLTMRAIFANDDAKGDGDKNALAVWTGRIASPAQDYRVFWLD